jgi:hypothetical protein
MAAKETPQGTFHDAVTHETYSRELTEDEIAALPQATDETPITG